MRIKVILHNVHNFVLEFDIVKLFYPDNYNSLANVNLGIMQFFYTYDVCLKIHWFFFFFNNWNAGHIVYPSLYLLIVESYSSMLGSLRRLFLHALWLLYMNYVTYIYHTSYITTTLLSSSWYNHFAFRPQHDLVS